MQGIHMYNDVRWEYMKLLDKQETYWKQCAKQFWLQGRDKNTRFFHCYASGRKKQCSVLETKMGSGRKRLTR